MGIVELSPEEAIAASVEALGFDPSAADFETPEVLAESVRRAASFLCPAPSRHIVRRVMDALVPLCSPAAVDAEVVAEMVDALVAHGDLVEAPLYDDDRGQATRVLFLGRPAYVEIREDVLLLLGVRGDGQPLLDEGLAHRVEPRHHTRSIRLSPGEVPEQVLGPLGMIELSDEHWLRRPPTSTPDHLLAQYLDQLLAAGPAGTIESLRLLDPETRVSYYRGRWREVQARDSGSYVARRPQAFGADGWCFAQVESGVVSKLVDLPLRNQLEQAHDEAWRLQAAIDATRGRPQRVRALAVDSERAEVHLFSPVPSWAQRRLDAVGRPLGRRRGALFAYEVPAEQVEREIDFLRSTMWMALDDRGDA